MQFLRKMIEDGIVLLINERDAMKANRDTWYPGSVGYEWLELAIAMQNIKIEVARALIGQSKREYTNSDRLDR